MYRIYTSAHRKKTSKTSEEASNRPTIPLFKGICVTRWIIFWKVLNVISVSTLCKCADSFKIFLVPCYGENCKFKFLLQKNYSSRDTVCLRRTVPVCLQSCASLYTMTVCSGWNRFSRLGFSASVEPANGELIITDEAQWWTHDRRSTIMNSWQTKHKDELTTDEAQR